MSDAYLDRMLEDLEVAENILRSDLDNLRNPFRTDGEERVRNAQANVDRLHELIREYMQSKTQVEKES